jgi:hypothetical protein
MDPFTIALLAAGSAGLKFGGTVLGSSAKQQQAARVAKQQQRAQEINRFNRARLMTYQDDERIRLHNYQVEAYKRMIPQAFNRAALAYQDNNAQLTELIDQYQFAGQDRLAKSIEQRGALAARGITGRGAATADVALDSALGRSDQLMARNLLAARYGTERANQRVRQQLTDYLQSAYNRVGFTPQRTPGGMLGAPMDIQPTFNGNDAMMGNFAAGLDFIGSTMGAFAGLGGSGKTPAPQPMPNYSGSFGNAGNTWGQNIPNISPTNYKLPTLD